MTFDDIGQHEVDNDKVKSSFGDKMKTCLTTIKCNNGYGQK